MMMNRMRILIVSRCQSAANTAMELLRDRSAWEVDARVLTNGSVDPLQGVSYTPDLLLVYDHGAEGELETLQRMPADARPELLVYGTGDNARAIRLAMRAGARDYLTIPLDRKELVDAVDEVLKLRSSAVVTENGNLHVFINGKGGSGATFLATNIAHGLAVDGHKVTLVDLDLQFSGLCRYLDMTPKQDILEAIRAIDDMDELAAEAFTTRHDSGLRLLASSGERLVMNQEVPPENMLALIDKYRAYNDYVIVDLPRHIDAMNAAILESADRVTVVTQQSFPHLHDTARLLNILRTELHIDGERISVVVNRYSKNLPIMVKDIESALHTDALIRIPNQYRVTSESVNSGVPLSEVDRKSAVTRGLKEIYASIDEATVEAPGPLGRALPSLFRR
jgi:pilus assembly protein CpaE